MKIRHLIVCGAWLGVAVLAPGLARADSNGGIYGPSTLEASNGAQVYQHICQGCHMPDGKGAVGAGHYPAFAGNPTLASAPYVAATVLYGRHDMPSFIQYPHAHASSKFFGRVTLSDTQVAGVVNYIRSHFGNHYTDRLTAADVAALRTPTK